MKPLVRTVSPEFVADLTDHYGLTLEKLSSLFTEALGRPTSIVTYKSDEVRTDFNFRLELSHKDRYFRLFITEVEGRVTNLEVWKSPKPLSKSFDRLKKSGRVG